MKVLWFECTAPGRYQGDDAILGGWQDSLETIVREVSDIELTIAFEGGYDIEERVVSGVRYIPLSLKSKAANTRGTNWREYAQITCCEARKVIEETKPDIIQIFGTEWPYGLVAKYTDIPVIIHIQGAIVSYNNVAFPPRYSIFDVIRNEGLKRPMAMYRAWRRYKQELLREDIERQVWSAVGNYMGRTEWDKALSAVMHPGRRYFHVEEALRPVFLNCDNCWHFPEDGKTRLISTGIISFRKGIDMMLKTAEILKSLNFNFEWHVAGVLPYDMKQMVERKEGRQFDNCNIIVHGFLPSDKVWKLLSEATIYVHTAYAENSPNSICEAQCLGIPVISTNVGGISSLVRNGEDGILVPANDPWYMAYQIIQLSSDVQKMQEFSVKARGRAMKRHNKQVIIEQLLESYKDLIKKRNGSKRHVDALL